MEMGMLGLRGDVLLVAPASFHHDSLLTTEHPIIPLLTSTPLDDNQRAKAPAGIQFWQPQSQPVQQHLQNPNPNPSLSYLKKPVAMLDAAGFLTGGGHSTCQDCGNQAKKDCIHHRCRTCCKSRGFNCSTHVKSTWVPAARRRERQQFSGAGAGAGSSASASTSAPKKPRLISSQTTTTTSTSNTTPPRSIDTTSSHQDPSFRDNLPGHVRAPAVFKCVRVTSIDDGEDEYAYQAMVRIGGHMFKGFLYDQGEDTGRGGEDDTRIAATGDNNNSTIPNMSELNLGGAGRNGASSSSGMLQADLYGGSGFLGGTSYGNQIN